MVPADVLTLAARFLNRFVDGRTWLPVDLSAAR